MSDSATTCHILALRSTTSSGSSSTLGSLCHLDSTNNGSCIRRMVQQHAQFHAGEKDEINMEIHISGGYRDKGSISSETTAHILNVLSDLASQYKAKMSMTLSTCITTSLNDEEFLATKEQLSTTCRSQPIVRGMSLNVKTGAVQLLDTIDESLRGPDATLRRVRLWASSPSTSTNDDVYSSLMVVHSVKGPNDFRNGRIRIQPFEFAPFPDMELFMALPDDIMLQYSSTSPECEADDFCDLIRKSCAFMRDNESMGRSGVFLWDGSLLRNRTIVHSWDSQHNLWRKRR